VRLLWPLKLEAEFVHDADAALRKELRAGLQIAWPTVVRGTLSATVAYTPYRGDGRIEIDSDYPISVDGVSDLDFYANEFFNRSNDFLLACHIAQPGGLRIKSTRFTLDTQRVTSKYTTHVEPLWIGIDEATEKLGTPIVSHLSIAKTWSWFANIADIGQNISEDQIWRAINYLRQAMDSDPRGEAAEYHRLIWVMMGLEALYGESGRQAMPMASQMGNKIMPFVSGLRDTGETRFQSQLQALYEVRNKLFHGKLSSPRLNFLEYMSPAFDKFFAKTVGVTHIGLALLIATFQELIERNWHSLEFTTHNFYNAHERQPGARETH
jgi:hypothetical protein